MSYAVRDLERAIRDYFDDGNRVGSLDEDDFWNNYGWNEACSQPFYLEYFGEVNAVDFQGMHVETDNYADSSTAWKIHTIISVTDDYANVRYFGKFGEEDSWGGSEGLGDLVEVNRTEKIVYEWEPI